MNRPCVCALLLPLLLVPACGPPPPAPVGWDPSGHDAAPYVRRLEARVESLDTIKAALEIVWVDPTTNERESCRGSLSFDREHGLRLRGTSAAFFTVFDLVVGADEVWLDVPREGVTVFGARHDESWNDLPLSPDRLLLALLSFPCPGEPCLERAEFVPSTSREDGSVVQRFRGVDWEFDIDPANGLPLRYEVQGSSAFAIEWRNWGERRSGPWPEEIEIREPHASTLFVRLGRIAVGASVSRSGFRFETPDGRDVLTPSEARGLWESALDQPES